ncbi:MAG: hypothetical protein K2Z81_03580, partial [Cyanobacteria bacterium]|nr:hypothetical protein [Cyanobacteriota bacterium]
MFFLHWQIEVLLLMLALLSKPWKRLAKHLNLVSKVGIIQESCLPKRATLTDINTSAITAKARAFGHNDSRPTPFNSTPRII